MRAYELMIIFDGDVEDAAVTEALGRVTQMVEAGNGRVATTDLWGRRRFAYEINHKLEGIYVVLEIVTEAPNLDDIERSLRLADDVVRHKLIRLPDREAAQRGLLGDATPVEAAAAPPES
jgi:small subunit ribosomal protein S6